MTIFLYPQNYLGLQFVEEPTRGAEKCREKCQQPTTSSLYAWPKNFYCEILYPAKKNEVNLPKFAVFITLFKTAS